MVNTIIQIEVRFRNTVGIRKPETFKKWTFYVRFSNGRPFKNQTLFHPVFKCHSKTGPFGNQPNVNHLKTGHARISDPHCISFSSHYLNFEHFVQCLYALVIAIQVDRSNFIRTGGKSNNPQINTIFDVTLRFIL